VPSGLRQRIVTALLLAGALVAILFWLPAAVAVAAVMLVVTAGAWEWAGFAGLTRAPERAAYMVAVGLAIAAAWWLTATPGALLALLFIALAWWLVAFAWIMKGAGRGGATGAAVAGFLVLVPAAVAIGRLVAIEPDGRELLFVLVILIAAADIGAYFGGRRFGRHKLAPRVSPGKTWEGFAAGVLAAGVAAVATGRLLGMPEPEWLIACVAVALLSVVGDLVESMFKRRVGLKDSGRLLPGHGGVLDRVDSLTAAGPAFLLALLLLGVAG
jgi:phosphatidate cytidylyltransferase